LYGFLPRASGPTACAVGPIFQGGAPDGEDMTHAGQILQRSRETPESDGPAPGRREHHGIGVRADLVLSIPLGMLVAQGRMSRHWAVSKPVSFYIYIMRSTPLMLQVMFIYFLLPQVLPFNPDRFWSVIFAFVINYAAYFAESSAAAFSRSRRDSGRRRRCWATRRRRRSFASSSPRWSSG
jgi:His/Glu/Gln/Arg/opine family amino acid ABC transporter permease subunit